MSFKTEPKFLGRGWSAVVKGYQVWFEGRCRRCISPDDDSRLSLAREDIVYQRLGLHPHILRYYGRIEVAIGVYSLHLELAPWGSLRDLILSTRDPPPIETRSKMALQISFEIAYMHSKSVIHCDISCRNVLVFPDWFVKIGDFGGSKIDDEDPLDVAEEIRYELPRRGRKWEERPYIKRELFALGSAMCEIVAWKRPFDEFTDDDVEKNYAEEKFPDVSGLLVGSIIRRCWDEQFERADDVRIALEAF